MAGRRHTPLDAETMAEVILAHCLEPEDGALAEMLREALLTDAAAAREAIQRPEVQVALALRISATAEPALAMTALLLRTLRQVDPVAAAAVVAECDMGALARTLSYVVDYSAQQVNLLARVYSCNPQVGQRIFARCGTLLKEFLAQSSFPYLDLPEDLIADVERWKERG